MHLHLVLVFTESSIAVHTEYGSLQFLLSVLRNVYHACSRNSVAGKYVTSRTCEQPHLSLLLLLLL